MTPGPAATPNRGSGAALTDAPCARNRELRGSGPVLRANVPGGLPRQGLCDARERGDFCGLRRAGRSANALDGRRGLHSFCSPATAEAKRPSRKAAIPLLKVEEIKMTRNRRNSSPAALKDCSCADAGRHARSNRSALSPARSETPTCSDGLPRTLPSAWCWPAPAEIDWNPSWTRKMRRPAARATISAPPACTRCGSAARGRSSPNA